MSEYIPSPRQWVCEQVELYEKSGGKEGTTLRDTGLPVIIVTHRGNKTGRDPQDAPDAREGWRPVRADRLDGRRADQPGVGVQPTHESRRRDS